MKKKTGNKIKLGIFVIVALAVLISGIYFIGERQQLFSETFQISSVFKDINGLQIGNNVRFSGINIGIVDNIEQTSDSTVRVDMVINENSKQFIKKNATAVIGTDGLMGNKLILIAPGAPGQKPVEHNDVIESTKAISIDDIMVRLKTTGDNAANITGDLAAIMKNIKEGKGTVGKLFMDTTFADNVDKTLVNVKQAAGGLKQNMTAASHSWFLRGFFKKRKKDREKNKEKSK
jgi:phospholipid/cholesterol/gamma-HCH transport system substrate-binding protein